MFAVRSSTSANRGVFRGSNGEYAVQRGLNLINELFVALHESYPDYLIEHFGLSPE